MIEWKCKYFTDLTNEELYSIIQLRLEVFVVEQNCVFQDCDNKDQHSHHLAGWLDQKLVAYARLLPPGVAYPLASIGRVVTSPSARKKGFARELMNIAIQKIKDLYGPGDIKIGAQLYLEGFYSSFGFHQSGDIYLEDGIEHIEMILT